jgi:DHA2 family multidrug resistance protein
MESQFDAKKVAIILTAGMAALLEIVDSSIVNVAIPSMMGNLGVTLDEISWVSTGYMIANSIVLPIAAWLGSRLGRQTYFTSAIIAFTLTSFACGIAPNLPVLVFFRILQGLAGGALLPTSQTLIQEQFPREKAGLASAVFGMTVMIGPALGPTLGGYLTDHFGWRMIFNINVPLGLAAAAMSYLNIENGPKLDKHKNSGIDFIGLILLCVGVGCFQFILERGEVEGWWDSNLIRTLAFFAATGITSFIWWELKVTNPIMNLRLFKDNAVRSGTLLMLCLGVMVYSLTFVVPIFVDHVVHLTATQTGELFIPGSLLTIVAMMFVGNTLKFVNPKWYVLIGMGMGEAALLSMSHFTTATGETNIYTPLILRGVASAFLFAPINGMILGQYAGEELGQVSGMMNFFRQIGGSVGIASLSTMLTRFSYQNYADIMPKVSLLNANVYRAYEAGKTAPVKAMNSSIGMWTGEHMSVTSLYGRTMRQVFIMSFSQLCWVIMITFALALIPLYLVKVKGKVEMVHDSH